MNKSVMLLREAIDRLRAQGRANIVLKLDDAERLADAIDAAEEYVKAHGSLRLLGEATRCEQYKIAAVRLYEALDRLDGHKV